MSEDNEADDDRASAHRYRPRPGERLRATAAKHRARGGDEDLAAEFERLARALDRGVRRTPFCAGGRP